MAGSSSPSTFQGSISMARTACAASWLNQGARRRRTGAARGRRLAGRFSRVDPPIRGWRMLVDRSPPRSTHRRTCGPTAVGRRTAHGFRNRFSRVDPGDPDGARGNRGRRPPGARRWDRIGNPGPRCGVSWERIWWSGLDIDETAIWVAYETARQQECSSRVTICCRIGGVSWRSGLRYRDVQYDHLDLSAVRGRVEEPARSGRSRCVLRSARFRGRIGVRGVEGGRV